MKVRRTASLAFLSLSSTLALFKVLNASPNMLFPRFRSRPPPVKSMRGLLRSFVADVGSGELRASATPTDVSIVSLAKISACSPSNSAQSAYPVADIFRGGSWWQGKSWEVCPSGPSNISVHHRRPQSRTPNASASSEQEVYREDPETREEAAFTCTGTLKTPVYISLCPDRWRTL